MTCVRVCSDIRQQGCNQTPRGDLCKPSPAQAENQCLDSSCAFCSLSTIASSPTEPSPQATSLILTLSDTLRKLNVDRQRPQRKTVPFAPLKTKDQPFDSPGAAQLQRCYADGLTAFELSLVSSNDRPAISAKFRLHAFGSGPSVPLILFASLCLIVFIGVCVKLL